VSSKGELRERGKGCRIRGTQYLGKVFEKWSGEKKDVRRFHNELF